MTTALMLAEPELVTAPKDWVPEAGYANRVRRDRRQKSKCEVCKRDIHGYGRLCDVGFVNNAAPWGCTEWLRSLSLRFMVDKSNFNENIYGRSRSRAV